MNDICAHVWSVQSDSQAPLDRRRALLNPRKQPLRPTQAIQLLHALDEPSAVDAAERPERVVRHLKERLQHASQRADHTKVEQDAARSEVVRQHVLGVLRRGRVGARGVGARRDELLVEVSDQLVELFVFSDVSQRRCVHLAELEARRTLREHLEVDESILVHGLALEYVVRAQVGVDQGARAGMVVVPTVSDTHAMSVCNHSVVVCGQRMLESDKLKRDHEDRGRELSANRREIGALQTGLSPIEERLAAELNASNRRAAALQAQLASITTSQADQVDLTASDAQETAAHRGRAQLIRDQGDDDPGRRQLGPRKELAHDIQGGSARKTVQRPRKRAVLDRTTGRRMAAPARTGASENRKPATRYDRYTRGGRASGHPGARGRRSRLAHRERHV